MISWEITSTSIFIFLICICYTSLLRMRFMQRGSVDDHFFVLLKYTTIDHKYCLINQFLDKTEVWTLTFVFSFLFFDRILIFSLLHTCSLANLGCRLVENFIDVLPKFERSICVKKFRSFFGSRPIFFKVTPINEKSIRKRKIFLYKNTFNFRQMKILKVTNDVLPSHPSVAVFCDEEIISN